MITIISISLALLVIVAGLLLLAKTKKEELGGLFTFSSYAVITCGVLLAAHAFIGCMLMCHSNQGGCGKASYAQCHGSGQGGGSCASYSKGSCKSGHSGYHSEKGGHHSKEGCSKSSCSKNSKSCSKSSKCCSKKKSGHKKEVHKIIKTEGDGKEDVDVTIEIIE